MPPPQIRDPMHMHIDTDTLRASPRSAHAQVGHLGPDTRQAHEPVDGIGDVAREAVAQEERRGFDVAGLVVVEADGVDEVVEACGLDGQDAGKREAARERMLEGVDRGGGGGVFRLRGEHERDEGLEALVLFFPKRKARGGVSTSRSTSSFSS